MHGAERPVEGGNGGGVLFRRTSPDHRFDQHIDPLIGDAGEVQRAFRVRRQRVPEVAQLGPRHGLNRQARDDDVEVEILGPLLVLRSVDLAVLGVHAHQFQVLDVRPRDALKGRGIRQKLNAQRLPVLLADAVSADFPPRLIQQLPRLADQAAEAARPVCLGRHEGLGACAFRQAGGGVDQQQLRL